MKYRSTILKQIEDSIATKERILSDSLVLSNIAAAAELIIKAFKNVNKNLIAGNGGSAADAQHIAAEFVGRFYFNRPSLPSVSLTTDTSIITAISNDFGYNEVFSRQIQALGKKNDIFIGISTSGNSINIINALAECKKIGIKTVGFTGNSSSEMDKLCDICVKIPSSDTPHIQEAHIMIGHIICCIVEEELFGRSKNI